MPPKKKSSKTAKSHGKMWKKIKKHGPAVGVAALALGTVAAGMYLHHSERPRYDVHEQQYPEWPRDELAPHQKYQQMKDAQYREREISLDMKKMEKENFFKMQDPIQWREGQVIHESRGRAGIDD